MLFFSSKKCTFGTPQTRAQCPKKCVRKLKKRVRFWAHYWGAAYRESVKHQVPKSDVLKKCFLGNSHKYGWNLVKHAQKNDFKKKTLRLTMVFVIFFQLFVLLLIECCARLCVFWAKTQTLDHRLGSDSRTPLNVVKRRKPHRRQRWSKNKPKTHTSIFGPTKSLFRSTVLIWTLQPRSLVHLV